MRTRLVGQVGAASQRREADERVGVVELGVDLLEERVLGAQLVGALTLHLARSTRRAWRANRLIGYRIHVDIRACT